MKQIIFAVLLIISIDIRINAQQLYVCRSYSERGEPVDASLEWQINPAGTKLYLFYNNGRETFKDNTLFLFIDKLRGSNFIPYESKSIKPDKKKNWFAFDYSFSEAGKYEISVINTANKKLASVQVTLTYTEIFPAEEDSEEVQKYPKAEMVFCDGIINNSPSNIKSNVSIKNDKGETYVFIDAKADLNTEIIVVDFWRRGELSREFDIKADRKKYKVNTGWQNIYFKYKFKTPGFYRLDISAENGDRIVAGEINVSN